MKNNHKLKTRLMVMLISTLVPISLLHAQYIDYRSLSDTLYKVSNHYFTTYNLHGLSYSVILPNDSIITVCYGNVNDSVDIDTSRRWMFASCVKNIISTAILDLHEEGLLSIDDSIYKYFTHPKIDSTFTVKQLLNHTTNFLEFNGTSQYFYEVLNDPERIWGPLDVLNTLVGKASTTPDFHFSYCNTNYLVLGLIIEEITGNSLNEELRTRYFNKLGMNHTSLAPADYSFNQLAGAWFDTDRDGILNDLSLLADEPLNSTLSISYASGDIVSTTSDMARWVKALYSGSILSDTSLNEMKTCTPGTCSEGLYRGYGLGMEHLYFDDCHHYGHSGHMIHTSGTYYCPELSIALAIVMNESAENIIKQLHMEIFGIIKEFCEPTSDLKNMNAKQQQVIKLYPSPSYKGKINILFDPPVKEVVVEIYNTSGILLYRSMMFEEYNIIDIGKINKGIYLVRIYNKEVIYTDKLIIG